MKDKIVRLILTVGCIIFLWPGEGESLRPRAMIERYSDDDAEFINLAWSAGHEEIMTDRAESARKFINGKLLIFSTSQKHARLKGINIGSARPRLIPDT